MMKKWILAFGLFCLLFSQAAFADDKAEVTALMDKKVEEVFHILKNGKLSKEKKDSEILTVLKPIFDFELMAKLALGSKHWNGMDKKQREQYSGHFVHRLQESYLEKMNLYTDEKIIYKGTELDKKKIRYNTELVSKSDKIPMEYRLYKGKTGWKVYDVIIMGVSVLQTYRSQFHSLLQKGNYDQLIEGLKRTKT